MRVKVFLFPEYIHLDRVEFGSPTLWQILKEQGIELEEMRWGGTLDSLPKDEPVLVRGSSMMACSWKELAHHCRKPGHFVFYDDQLVQHNGELASGGMEIVLINWLKKNKFIQ